MTSSTGIAGIDGAGAGISIVEELANFRCCLIEEWWRAFLKRFS
jgi:hypothetical protein